MSTFEHDSFAEWLIAKTEEELRENPERRASFLQLLKEKPEIVQSNLQSNILFWSVQYIAFSAKKDIIAINPIEDTPKVFAAIQKHFAKELAN